MVRLPWLIRTRFWVPTNFFQKLKKKQIFQENFLFYDEIGCCVYSLESPHWGDSNEYTQHITIVWKIEKIPSFFFVFFFVIRFLTWRHA